MLACLLALAARPPCTTHLPHTTPLQGDPGPAPRDGAEAAGGPRLRGGGGGAAEAAGAAACGHLHHAGAPPGGGGAGWGRARGRAGSGWLGRAGGGRGGNRHPGPPPPAGGWQPRAAQGAVGSAGVAQRARRRLRRCSRATDKLLPPSLPPSPQDLTPRAKDSLVSFGERLSTRLFAAFLNAQGIAARQYDAYAIGVTTNDNFVNAEVRPRRSSRGSCTAGAAGLLGRKERSECAGEEGGANPRLLQRGRPAAGAPPPTAPPRLLPSPFHLHRSTTS